MKFFGSTFGALVVCALAAICTWYLWLRPEAQAAPLPDDGAYLEATECWFDVAAQTDQLAAQSAMQAFECYRFKVTEAGQQFDLPVVVLKALAPSESAVLYLSGGPGGSAFLTAEDMTYWQAQYQRLALNADLVLVDRRGTGLALPALQCEVFRRDYRRALSKDYSAHRENDVIYRSMSACFDQYLSPAPERNRIAVSALGTRADQRDMSALMVALSERSGYQQWHLWGVSYGTRLALAIAEASPDYLASLILDSVYPPGRGSNDEWPVLMNDAMQRFFRWCDQNACTQYHGDTWPSEQMFQQVLQRLDRHPMTLSLPSWYGDAPYTMVVNGQRFLQIVFGAIYDQYLWATIGVALKEIPMGDDNALSSLSENFINNAFDPIFSELVFYAAECKDNLPSMASDVDAALAQSPHYRRYLEGQMQWDICAAKAFEGLRGSEQLSLQLPTQISVPVFMLNGAIDPITPADWLAPLQTQLPLWQSAVFEDVGHAVVASDVCAEHLLADFLRNPLHKLRVSGENCRADKIQLRHAPSIQ